MEVKNPCQLEQALLKAEKAHAEYEKTLGHRDGNWAWWYASYIFKNQNKEVFRAEDDPSKQVSIAPLAEVLTKLKAQFIKLKEDNK